MKSIRLSRRKVAKRSAAMKPNGRMFRRRAAAMRGKRPAFV